MEVYGLLTVAEIRTIIIPLVEKYPVRRVILFGSYARGDATVHSDIDLIIDSENNISGFDFFGIAGRIIKEMPVKIDVFEMGEIEISSKLNKNIIQDGVVIYEA